MKITSYGIGFIITLFCGLIPLKLYTQTLELNNQLTEKHLEIEGTNLAMVPPPGFINSNTFTGLVLEDKNASVLVVSMPAPFETLTEGFTQENLQQRKIRILSKDSLILNRKQGLLLLLEQEAQGTTFQKWLLAFGSDDKTFLINGIYPKALADELGEAVKKSVLSCLLIKEKIIDPLKEADFDLKIDTSKIQFATGIQNSTLIFTADGKLPPQSDDKTLFIAGKSLGKAIVTDQKEFAKNRISELPVIVNEIREKDVKKINIGGLDGYEITVYGKGENTNTKELVFQVILFQEEIYYILIGTTNMDFQENLNMFRKTVQSFTLK